MERRHEFFDRTARGTSRGDECQAYVHRTTPPAVHELDEIQRRVSVCRVNDVADVHSDPLADALINPRDGTRPCPRRVRDLRIACVAIGAVERHTHQAETGTTQAARV